LEPSRRSAVSTYLETFILIGIVVGASVLVYAMLGGYSASLQGPSISVSDASIRQGSGLAIETFLLSDTGNAQFASFTLTNAGLSSSTASYGVSLQDQASGSTINTLTTGLAGYWRFDDGSGSSASDGSANGNTGTLVNSPSWLASGSCVYAGCLGFASASSQYVTIGSPAPELATTAGTFTAWVDPGADASGTVYTIAGYGGAAATNAGEWTVYLKGTGSADNLYVSQRSNGASALNTVEATTTSLGLNAWYFVAVEGTGSAWTMSINGVSQTLSVLSGSNAGAWIGGTTVTATSALQMGELYSNGAQQASSYFTGRLDDVRAYNRILSATETSTLYTETAPFGRGPSSITVVTTLNPGQSVIVTVTVYSGGVFAPGTKYGLGVAAGGASAQLTVGAVPA
jgi:hypothetical protein